MKFATLTSLIILILLTALLQAEDKQQIAAHSEKDFLISIKDLVKKKDKKALLRLSYLKGARDDSIKAHENIIDSILNSKVKAVYFDKDFKSNNMFNKGFIIKCKTIHPNIPFLGRIVFELERGSFKYNLKVPYGKKDGYYYFANTTHKVADMDAPNNYSIVIKGETSPKPITFKGYYTFVKAGIEIKKAFNNKVLYFENICAQNFNYIKIYKTSPGWIQVIISEDGNYLFNSNIHNSDDAIVFKNQ